MKTIVSFKINPVKVKLNHVMDLYSTCFDTGQRLYLYRDGRTTEITRMTELLSFVLTAQGRRLLVIIEGNKAKDTMNYLFDHLFPSRDSQDVI